MSEKIAKRIAVFMMMSCAVLAAYNTFVKQDIILTLVAISCFFTFQFAHENPSLLMSTTWKEFGERADIATGKEKLIGTPWYFAAVFFSVLYIIIA